MPLYDYKCPDCGMFYGDVFTKPIDVVTELPYICEECEGELTRCFPNRTSFRLRGSGWAKDGYRG